MNVKGVHSTNYAMEDELVKTLITMHAKTKNRRCDQDMIDALLDTIAEQVKQRNLSPVFTPVPYNGTTFALHLNKESGEESGAQYALKAIIVKFMQNSDVLMLFADKSHYIKLDDPNSIDELRTAVGKLLNAVQEKE